MTNFDVIADRIIAAEGVSFAIACGIHEHTGISYDLLRERREALKRAIVDALSDVFADAVKTTHELDRAAAYLAANADAESK
jgi:hypothetical protein